MSIRTGSLGGQLETLDQDVRAALLEDYRVGKRRDHCSRVDFADGWLALLRRIREDPEARFRLLME